MRIDPPRWLFVSALVAGGAVLSFGSAGLLLAVNGRYSPGLALPLGAIGLVALMVLTLPMVPVPSMTPRAAHLGALVGTIAILAITVWNSANASQHVLIDRDGGAYAETGRWIARDGGLGMVARGPFKGAPDLVFSFAHLLPSLLAEAYSIGGSRGMYQLPPLLGGIALIEFFVLAWRLLRRPAFALAATLALGLTIPQVTFARDSYSEIVSQILLFAALALLVERRGLPHWRMALAAGLFLGATQAARIDSTVFFIGVPAMIAIAWLRVRTPAERHALIAPTVAFVLGLVPGCALGIVDLVHHSGGYWNRLWPSERSIIFLTTASVVVCAFAVLMGRSLLRFVRPLPWNLLSWVASGVVGVAAFGAWFLRPHLQVNHRTTLLAVQSHGHLAVEVARFDYERSMIWMSWYLGPLTLAAAIIAAALLAPALRRGLALHALSPLMLLVPGGVLYLWKANVFTDHVWVTRRFLVATFPLLVLLAVGLAAYLWTAPLSRRWARAGRAGALVIAIVAVAYPTSTVIPVRSMREQAGYLAVVQDACRIMGDHAAVVVLEQPQTSSPEFLEAWTPQAFQGWCGARATLSRYGFGSAATLRRLAREWKTRGRPFFVVAATAAPILALIPDAHTYRTRRVTNARLLSTTLTRRPNSYTTQSFSLVVAAIPTQ